MWLVKVKRYRGGESIVSYHKDRTLAEEVAYQHNFAYQTDAYYVEEYTQNRNGGYDDGV